MALNYDTDIELLFPGEVFEDVVCGPVLKQLGMAKEAGGNKVLLFTNPLTVAALNAADEAVKKVFQDSGVGLVLCGWRQREKAAFLIETIRGLSEKYKGDEKALYYAVWDLFRFVREGVMGRREPNPFAAPLTDAPAETFDLASALKAMAEQANKPKASLGAFVKGLFR